VRRALIAVLLAASSLIGPFAASPALAAGLPPNHAQFVARVIELVNAERQRVGQPALTANASLTRASQAYAILLADGSCFAHDCGGTSPLQRALAAGYPTNWLAMGENIAAGQATPEAAMAAFMASPAHRNVLLGANYRDIGIGLTMRSNGTLVWVQGFARSGAAVATVPPSNCTPRPAFGLTTSSPSQGTLQVTVTPGRPAGAPGNTLKTIRFGAVANGSIDIAGYGSPSANTSVGVAPGTSQLTFTLRRATNGAPTTVPLILTDDCGDWPTFVGGGRTAF
jgi:uncharacterized protein YkwD